ncbi:Glycosyl hydrolase (fragment) [Candidatus Sulfopaludibacter sp. SbA4]
MGKIVIHPTDPKIVWVAAAGHLWGSNPERGVFKTIDGGKTWKKVLYRDENTGAIDLAMDPRDPEVVFAAMYQRQRKGWGFNGGGAGSGIFRTSDGGATWTELRTGLPRGDKGRIGLAIFPGDNRIVYAIVEADPAGRGGGRGEGEAPPGEAPAAPAGRGGRGGRGGAPAAATSGSGGVFRSLDQGETWEHMTGLNPRPMYYSRIYVDPKDANRVYIMGSNRGFYVSDDAGRNFRDVFSGVHGEDHVLWVDPDNTNRLVIGGDGGVSISYDRGLSWLFRINLPIGQFYNISTNNHDPFLVCGGLQDNGSWCTPTATNIGYGVSFKEAFNVGGGDGMHAVFDGDDRTLLVSSQNGSTQRLDLETMERQSIGPVQPEERPKPGAPGYRWYWTTPLIVSNFSPNTIYTGANVVFRSDDRGVSWKAISPDVTANVDREKLEMMGGPVPPNALSRHDGQTNFSALTVIAESPLDRNLLYTGADDGTIQITRDGGQHWTNLTENVRGLPPRLNISGIAPSKHVAGRVYLTVDGHFNDTTSVPTFSPARTTARRGAPSRAACRRPPCTASASIPRIRIFWSRDWRRELTHRSTAARIGRRSKAICRRCRCTTWSFRNRERRWCWGRTDAASGCSITPNRCRS